MAGISSAAVTFVAMLALLSIGMIAGIWAFYDWAPTLADSTWAGLVWFYGSIFVLLVILSTATNHLIAGHGLPWRTVIGTGIVTFVLGVIAFFAAGLLLSGSPMGALIFSVCGLGLIPGTLLVWKLLRHRRARLPQSLAFWNKEAAAEHAEAERRRHVVDANLRGGFHF